jgi:hypothetical protein
MTKDSSTARFRSWRAFYPFYLQEHQHPVSRILHFTGTGLIALWLALSVITGNAWWSVLIPVGGYGFAWVGHYFFERNRPATFQYPLYSLGSDFVLFWHLLTGRERFRPRR